MDLDAQLIILALNPIPELKAGQTELTMRHHIGNTDLIATDLTYGFGAHQILCHIPLPAIDPLAEHAVQYLEKHFPNPVLLDYPENLKDSPEPKVG